MDYPLSVFRIVNTYDCTLLRQADKAFGGQFHCPNNARDVTLKR